MEYQEALDYINSLELFGMKLGLENITALMEVLGNPQNDYDIIHVAGTNGKGSVVAFCSSILRGASINHGSYISPALVDFRERMTVNGNWAEEKEIVQLATEVKAAAQKIPEYQITFFEFITAMAFLHFKKKNVQVVLLEVGLGGRLDATNVANAGIAGITNISLEHTQVLGNTIAEIAREKAGIIKQHAHIFTTETNPEALSVFKEVCQKQHSILHPVGVENLEVSLNGKHQKINASLAKALMRAYSVREEDIENGLRVARWPGRLEIVQHNPTILLDCAHNPAGMKTAVDFIHERERERTICVLAISDDKNRDEMIQLLNPEIDVFIATQSKFKPTPVSELAASLQDTKKELHEHPEVKDAINKAKELATDADLIVIIGSIFMIGEAKRFL